MRGREGSPRAPLAPRPAVPAPLPPRPRLEGTVRLAAPESRIERRRPSPAQRRAPGLGGWGDGGVERARFRIAPRAARGRRALAAPAPAACRGGGYIVCPLDCSSLRDWQVSRVWAGPEAPTFGSPACDSLAWVVLGELCTQPPTPRRLPGGAFVPPSRVMVTIKCICGLPSTGPSDVNCLRLAG